MLKTFLGLDISNFLRNAGKADQTMGQVANSAKKHLSEVSDKFKNINPADDGKKTKSTFGTIAAFGGGDS
jgi:hypothetical protein